MYIHQVDAHGYKKGLTALRKAVANRICVAHSLHSANSRGQLQNNSLAALEIYLDLARIFLLFLFSLRIRFFRHFALIFEVLVGLSKGTEMEVRRLPQRIIRKRKEKDN